MNKFSNFTIGTDVADCGAMESDTIFKKWPDFEKPDLPGHYQVLF